MPRGNPKGEKSMNKEQVKEALESVENLSHEEMNKLGIKIVEELFLKPDTDLNVDNSEHMTFFATASGRKSHAGLARVLLKVVISALED